MKAFKIHSSVTHSVNFIERVHSYIAPSLIYPVIAGDAGQEVAGYLNPSDIHTQTTTTRSPSDPLALSNP